MAAKQAPQKKGKRFARYAMYSTSGNKLERKNKLCPKCGASSYLANHKDRLTCGKCGYVETKPK